MSPDQENLAIALLLERIHGDRAPVWIAEQIGRLALDGDTAGIARWRSVAAAWLSLREGTSH